MVLPQALHAARDAGTAKGRRDREYGDRATPGRIREYAAGIWIGLIKITPDADERVRLLDKWPDAVNCYTQSYTNANHG